MKTIAGSLKTTLVAAAAAAFLVMAVVTTVPAHADEAATAPVTVTDGVVAYYLHGNVRCATCRKLEAYTDEAIHSGFANAPDDGVLIWSVVNIDKPENKHFTDDFQLVTKSVVLAEYHNGTIVRFKNLDKVWQLVRNKDEYIEYVQNEASAFLEES